MRITLFQFTLLPFFMLLFPAGKKAYNFESVVGQNTSIERPVTVEICDNGIDDDADGLIDCFDPDCAGAANCDGFYYVTTNASDPCTYVPPSDGVFELEYIFKTDETAYPIDQRCAAYVGDMDGDGIPEIVSKDPNPAKIHIFSGVDGSIKQSIDMGSNSAFAQVALADVDIDGLGDIFVMETGNILARYEYSNANAVWKTAPNVGDDTNASDPQVADFNEDGIPEVYVGNRIFNSIDGTRLAIGTGNRGVYTGGDKYTLAFNVFESGDPKPGGGTFGAEADGLELIAGNQVYTVDIGNGTMDNGTLTVVSTITGANIGDGFVSIGDLDNDGEIDVIVMDGGRIYAWNPMTQTQIGNTYQLAGTTAGGRINVGDFDNDGQVEIGAAGRNLYVVLEFDMGTNAFVVKWQKTGLDDGSQRTGSTLFDFEGDGISEVVYSEEEFLHVWRGTDGAVLAEIPSEAGTRTEYPLVADVNGDGAAEIIVTAQNGNGPGFSGNDYISVYRSKSSPWVSGRPVWNQHSYHNTNINNDLTVPIQQQDILHPSFGGALNGFLVQSTNFITGGNPGFEAADGTAEFIRAVDAGSGNGASTIGCPDTINIEIEVKNIGPIIFPGVTPVAVYDGDPTVGAVNLLGVSDIGTDVPTGDSVIAVVPISVVGLPLPADVYVVLNDTGHVAANLPFDLLTDFPVTGTAECDFTNNIFKATDLDCLEQCGDGIDNDGDGKIDEPNIIATQTTGCPGTRLAQLTADSPGGTWSIISSIGSTIDGSGNVVLGNVPDNTPDIDTVIYTLSPCPDTILITTVDDTPPTITCPANQAANVDSNCKYSLADFTSSANSADNCSATGDINISQSPAIGSTLSLGVTQITLKATDELSNAASCTFNITVSDNENPSLTCPDDAVFALDANCEYKLTDYTLTASASDNCTANSLIVLTQSPAAGKILSGDETTEVVILTADDGNGNTVSCKFRIIVEDQSNPEIACPLDKNESLDANCEYTLLDYTSEMKVRDNCTAIGAIILSQIRAPGTVISGHGTVETIKLKADDGNGNTSECKFTITVTDDSAPSIKCPKDLTIAADAACSAVLGDYTSAALISDNCSDVADIFIGQSPLPGFTISGAGTTQIVTIKVSDERNNRASCDFTVTVTDDSDPTITCPNLQTLFVNKDCEISLPDLRNSATIMDNCTVIGDLSVAQVPIPGTVFSGNGTIDSLTLTVSDDAGNMAACRVVFQLVDTIPVTFACPASQTVFANTNCEFTLPDYAAPLSGTDNCESGPSIIFSQSPSAGTVISGHGTVETITITANDGNGNQSECDFDLTLNDNIPPTVVCPTPQTLSVDDNCPIALPDYTDAPSMTDNCNEPFQFTKTQTPAIGTMVSIPGTVVNIVITVDDGNGNTADCDFDVTLIDTIAPALTCPGAQIFHIETNTGCEAKLPDYTGLAIAENQCGGRAGITISQSAPPGTIYIGHETKDSITMTATDLIGNSLSCKFEVTLKDTFPSLVICPANMVEYVDTNCEFELVNYLTSVTFSDNCTANPSMTITQDPPSGTTILGDGTIQTVRVTADDANGNFAFCEFDLTLSDTLAPVFVCPENDTLTLDVNCEAVIGNYLSALSITENCALPSDISLTQNPTAGGTISGDGTVQPIMITAADGNGNSSDCTFDIVLNDTIVPTILCPGDVTDFVDTNCDFSIADYTSLATLDDNCTLSGSLSITQSPVSGTTVSGHATEQIITLTVDDDNNNSAQCDFKLTILDNLKPAITCPANKEFDVDGNCDFDLTDYTSEAIVSDNCTADISISVTQTPIAGTTIAGDSTVQIVTLLASDGNSNSLSCTFEILIVDNTEATITCPVDKTFDLDGNCEFSLTDYTSEAVTSDNCTANGLADMTQSPLSGTIISGDSTVQIVTLTFDDGNGNTADCTFEIIVNDVSNPTITCPADKDFDLDGDCEFALTDYTSEATIADNCTANGSILVTQSPISGTTVSGNGTIQIITLTADDGNGNTTDCTFNVTLDDPIAPTITCPASETLQTDANCGVIIPDYTTMAMVSDNCDTGSSLTVTQSPTPGGVLTGATTTQVITLIVDDGSDNFAQCTLTLSLADTLSPILNCPADLVINAVGCEYQMPDYQSVTNYSDNCSALGNIAFTQNPMPGEIFERGVVTVTLTATDENGNKSQCTFDVDFDLELPKIKQLFRRTSN